MADDKKEPMTPTGYERLVKEIEQIKSVERPENIKAIEEARGHGDLSENAEYHAAKEEQSILAARLAKCEDLLTRADVIDPSQFKGPDIVFGAKVTLEDVETSEQVVYRLVGSYEADYKEGSISIESPVGKALIGKKEGDEVRVKTPKGFREFAILSVEYPSE